MSEVPINTHFPVSHSHWRVVEPEIVDPSCTRGAFYNGLTQYLQANEKGNNCAWLTMGKG